MPDGQHLSSFAPDPDARTGLIGYVPPLAMILRGLDITELDLADPRVSVSSQFIRFLISEFARLMPFDPAHYAHANPDVEAARLAGDVATLHDHFIEQGYFERRQPHELPLDAFYYATQYDDLRQAFNPADGATLRQHFRASGWQEGRVGVSWQRRDADRWVAAARAGADSATVGLVPR